jgi:hypothetical protein
MTGLSQPQPTELSDKDNYSRDRHVAYARQLDRALALHTRCASRNRCWHDALQAAVRQSFRSRRELANDRLGDQLLRVVEPEAGFSLRATGTGPICRVLFMLASPQQSVHLQNVSRCDLANFRQSGCHRMNGSAGPEPGKQDFQPVVELRYQMRSFFVSVPERATRRIR